MMRSEFTTTRFDSRASFPSPADAHLKTDLRQPLSIASLLTLLLGISGCAGGDTDHREAILVGNSMAPTLWGKHFACKCQDCRYSFRIAAESAAAPEPFRCANCGERAATIAGTQPQPADRVRVQTSAQRRYDRWDVVAARVSPDQPAIIKRIVGLPRETLKFLGGDIFANDRVLRKPLTVARSMKIPVYDSKYYPEVGTPQLRPSSSVEHSNLDWVKHQGGFMGLRNEAAKCQWLRYHPRRCVESNLPADQPVPLEDWYAANASLNRTLNATNDFWLTMNCEWTKDSQFEIQVNYGTQTYVLEFNREPSCIVLTGKTYRFVPSPIRSKPGVVGSQIEICTFDQRLLVLINEQEAIRLELPLAANQQVPLIPFQIGSPKNSPSNPTSKLNISRVRLWRDVHYMDVAGERAVGGMPPLEAGNDEFLLFGDNVPMSIDSRHWPKPAVPAKALLGHVIPATTRN